MVPAGTTPFVPLAGTTVNTAPVHIDVAIAVTAAVGFTTMVKVWAVPLQVFETGVTVIAAVTAALVLFTAVNAAIFPDPLAPKPIEVNVFVQL